jgi:hypothetical protein
MITPVSFRPFDIDQTVPGDGATILNMMVGFIPVPD